MSRSFEINPADKVGAFACQLQGLQDEPSVVRFPQRPVTFVNRPVGIGDALPHFRLFLPALMPQCPTNLPVLPETVRSGTGS
jgi:hypothetical protein